MADGVFKDVHTKELIAEQQKITNPTTTEGLKIDQSGDATAIEVSTVLGRGLSIVKSGDGSEGAAHFKNETGGAGTDSVILCRYRNAIGSSRFYRDLASGSTAGPVVLIEQAEATDDQAALSVKAIGTAPAIIAEAVTAVNVPLRLVPQAAPPAGQEGDIYMDTDHHLYVHNGTAWVQLDN